MGQTQVINLRGPFLIAHSVFSNVYIVTKGKVKVNIKCSTVSYMSHIIFIGYSICQLLIYIIYIQDKEIENKYHERNKNKCK